MIHNQQANKRIQMFRRYKENLTKHWRRQIDFKAILIHQMACSTPKDWPIQRPLLNAPIQELKSDLYQKLWRTYNGIEHTERSSQIFSFYFEIKCQYYLQYFQSSIDWYSYSLFKIRNWLFHFCFRFLQHFIRLCKIKCRQLLNELS